MGIAAEVKAARESRGARTAKFENVGDVVRGTIVDSRIRQDRDDDNEPVFWKDGGKKESAVIIIQTDLDEGEDDKGRPDDGRRAVYVKWWGEQKRRLLDALAKVDRDDLVEGDELAVKFTGLGEKAPGAPRSHKPPKLFVYKITPGKGRTISEDEFDEPPAKKSGSSKPKTKSEPIEDDADDF